MASESKGLDVTIMGREFRIACPEYEQQALLESVDYLDKRMREIRDGGKVIGIERIAIMAALNITHDFLRKGSGGSLEPHQIRRRISDMQAQIEQAIADQNELF